MSLSMRALSCKGCSSAQLSSSSSRARALTVPSGKAAFRQRQLLAAPRGRGSSRQVVVVARSGQSKASASSLATKAAKSAELAQWLEAQEELPRLAVMDLDHTVRDAARAAEPTFPSTFPSADSARVPPR